MNLNVENVVELLVVALLLYVLGTVLWELLPTIMETTFGRNIVQGVVSGLFWVLLIFGVLLVLSRVLGSGARR